MSKSRPMFWRIVQRLIVANRGRLAGLRARRRIYIHINNSNPILREDSAERAEVEAAGVEVAFDGMEFSL